MANGTPESDFSIECFQNYSAPEVFIQGLAGMVNQTDVETMIRAQKQMLQRFEKTNEMLTNCNALSASRFKLAGTEFKKHTQLLLDMKKDLDYIFKKIRALRTKLSSQYPEAFELAQKAFLAKACTEDDENEDVVKTQPDGTALSKDLSKSTETLKPSISQVFSRSPNETEDKTSVTSEAVKHVPQSGDQMDTTADKIIVDDQEDADNQVGDKFNDVVVPRSRNPSGQTDKGNRASSGSSSSDNSNSCSSGDRTSDTG